METIYLNESCFRVRAQINYLLVKHLLARSIKLMPLPFIKLRGKRICLPVIVGRNELYSIRLRFERICFW